MKLIIKAIIIIATILASPVNAECNYPTKVQIPNGTINTTDEFVAGYNSVKNWMEKMNNYLDCIDKETTASITLLKINKEHTKEVEQRIIELQDKKYNAAVEDQQRVAQQLNEQVRAYKAAQASK
jgi:DNA repair ATPase RecN|tara:strand:+ start:21532 stop:21906 length:375 start_codon:yes stop_codon:yes gene_type:complete